MAIKLNREAWEPCKYCGDGRKSLASDAAGDLVTLEIGVNGFAAIESDSWGFLVSYCPRCARPLTDAAWAALEERIRRCAK